MGKYIYLKTKETLVTFTELERIDIILCMLQKKKKKINSIAKPVSYG